MTHPSIPCGCGSTAHPPALTISPYSAYPFPAFPLAFPLAFPPTPPRCPATTRHAPLDGTGFAGFQCKYEPGHDGDHAAYVGPGEGDIFWPQDAAELSSGEPAV